MKTAVDWAALARQIRQWGRELGFDELGFADIHLSDEAAWLRLWLARGRHGSMNYMSRHAELRAQPDALLPGTIRVISVRMNYLAPATRDSFAVLESPTSAYISRYALGRDYHKVMRQRLQRLGEKIEAFVGSCNWRAFSDSAPVMEVALARKAGIGWRGKNTLLLSRQAGSMFFLGELYVALPLPVDEEQSEHCGTCTRCIDLCPTGAIVAPYQLDARRCISYLTIEHKGVIPEELRVAMGNRIYGCDDCQLVCPWNKYAQTSADPDWTPRHRLDDVDLLELFLWTEAEFDQRMAGSAIRRIGYIQWQRNLAVALGNALRSAREDHTRSAIRAALQQRCADATPLLREHLLWALAT